VVAVIDTGVNYNEPDLVKNIYVNEAELNGQPGVDDDGNGFIDDVHGWDFAAKDNDPMDVYGHGTHVSGTIGASANDGVGITGVAWNVRILPVRFLGDDGGGSLADAVSSIDYATLMKVNIMSNSWGGGGFSQALMDSITHAKDAGILFVAAAGNSGTNLDNSPEYPASYQVDNVISVAAIDATGRLANFSNYGRNSVHLAAPGVGIVSHTMNGLESWDGTSMACPHVSGVAALLLSQDPTQSYATIKQRLINSVRPLAGLRNRVITGGMVNAYYALSNQTAPIDANDPSTWSKSAQSLASEHPYANLASQSWTMTVPGAKRVAVSFSRFETEDAYDTIEFRDAAGNVVPGALSGRLGAVFGPVVNGDTVTITLSSDKTVNAFGFEIDGVAYQQ
jgi:subtilisin family serine protease